MNRRELLTRAVAVVACLPFCGALKRKNQPPLGLLDDWRYVSAFEAQEVANYARRRGEAKRAAVEDYMAQVTHDRLKHIVEFYNNPTTPTRLSELDFTDLAKGMAKIWPPL